MALELHDEAGGEVEVERMVKGGGKRVRRWVNRGGSGSLHAVLFEGTVGLGGTEEQEAVFKDVWSVPM